MFNKYVITKQGLVMGIVSIFIITACGGGGGASDTPAGSNSVTYTGNQQAAVLDNQNASAFANQTFTGSNSASSSNVIGAQDVNNATSNIITSTLLNHTSTLSRSVNENRSAFATSTQNVVVDINVSATCPGGGNVVFTGNIDDQTNLGSFNVTYNNCQNDDVNINGSATLDINAYNAEIDEYSDVVLTFNNLRFVSLDPTDIFDVQVGANIRAQLLYTAMLDPYTKRVSIDMILANNASGASIKIENYLVDVVYDRYSTPTSATADISGRLYHHTYGFVDIETIAPLQFSSAAINSLDHELTGYPDAGGPLVYTGASNRKIRLTPVDAILVNVAADTNGDDFYEYAITVPWGSLQDDYVNENDPVANAGVDAAITLGQIAQLDGGLSTDADYNLIDFSWLVIDQPAGSNAGLIGSDSINPTLTPNMAGSYTVQLTVNDGWFTNTDTVLITVNP
ncbi:hypothetical protein MNBD_GAMMA21-1099 [hydrothermal vent metagenome]|uniref:PKD domain-containing protein n=1 Tax=hydrothermal vent metagenome TaxID=652676 RepID=A0A3B1AG18_9ZZZZ